MQQGRADFEAENSKLAQPYRILSKDEIVPAVFDLVEWVGSTKHAFSELSHIQLSASQQLQRVTAAHQRSPVRAVASATEGRVAS